MLQILFFVFREINILSRKTSSDPPKNCFSFWRIRRCAKNRCGNVEVCSQSKKQNITGESGRIKKKKDSAWLKLQSRFLSTKFQTHFESSQALNEKKDRWTTWLSQGCFVLACNKAHSAVKKKKNPNPPKNLKVIYSVGASSFPVNKATAEQASRQTSPPFCFFSLQGRDFFSWVAPAQNQIFGDKFEFSVFTDLRVSEVSTDPFIYFRGAEYVLLLQHTGSELKSLLLRCGLNVYQFRHQEILRVSVNHKITLAKRKLQYVRELEYQEKPSNQIAKMD